MVYKKMQNKTAKSWSWKQQWQTNWARLRWAKSCCITNKQTNGARKVGVDKCTRVDICTGSSATPIPAHAYHNYPGNPCNKFILCPHILHQHTLAKSSYSTLISCTNIPLPQVLTLPSYFVLHTLGPQDHALDHTYLHSALPNQSIKSIVLWQVCLICANIYSRQYPNATGKHSCRCIYDKRHVHSKHILRPCTWAWHGFM